MSAEQNLAASRRIVEEAWNEGNLGVIDQLCASDCVDHDLSSHEDTRGLAANKERVQMYRTAMPDLQVSIEDAVASGDEVATRWTARGTNDGELMGNPPTHKHVEITGMSIDRFDADGKLVEIWDQWDNLGFMQQLGMAPQMAGQAQS
jgi:steroid delta-isomerase-like uncharacterized protein